MGVKWIGRLKVEYEMEEGQPKNLAEMISRARGCRS